MTVKVRFAPSPTGRIHVGNVRTALMNVLFARGQGGQVLLRIDDTDLERSTAEYEQGIKDDLTWLGLHWDETFNQSHHFDRYEAAKARLVEAGYLYPCYETEDEIDRKRKIQRAQGKPPVYDRAALSLTDAERAALEAEGRKPHWRFKLSGGRIEWTDLVRGPSHIETSSVSDPILIRADGSYLYTLPSVVDDLGGHHPHHPRRGPRHQFGRPDRDFRGAGRQGRLSAARPSPASDGQGWGEAVQAHRLSIGEGFARGRGH